MSDTEMSRPMDAPSASSHRTKTDARADVARPARWLRFKHGIFNFFNSGRGSKLSMVVIDIHFWLWKLHRPNAPFSEYYAHSIAAELRAGRTHKTLGSKRFLSGSVISRPEGIDLLANRKRGTNYFAAAIRNGLMPEQRCVDIGCGSLRVGQHLITYLEPGNYLGLDIVSDFYQAGKTLLPPGLLERKRPKFGLIGTDDRDSAGWREADFIVSFAVLHHVPPFELDSYFRSIADLMAAQSKAMITFKQSNRTVRTGAKIWNYCETDLIASVSKLGTPFRLKIEPLAEGGGTAALPKTSVLLIERRDASLADIA